MVGEESTAGLVLPNVDGLTMVELETMEDVLEWLSPGDEHISMHQARCTKRLENTTRWVFQDYGFNEWCSAHEPFILCIVGSRTAPITHQANLTYSWVREVDFDVRLPSSTTLNYFN